MSSPGESLLPQRESVLLEAAQGGDRGAFACLVHESAPTLERLALRLVGHRQDAEDVAQDAVFVAWRELGRFEGRARFQTWLCRILVRRALDLIRGRRPAASDVEADAVAARHADPVELVSERETEDLIRAAIEKLPPVQRATLLLRVDQTLSYEEIAYVLGSNRNAVRVNLIAGRRKLARLLDGRLDPGGRAS